MSAEVLTRDKMLASYQAAASLLEAGLKPGEIQTALVHKGLSAEQAELIVERLPTFQREFVAKRRHEGNPVGLAMWAAGLFVFCLGLFFFFGNITGAFRTVPFAGYLTMMAGGALISSGMKLDRRL